MRRIRKGIISNWPFIVVVSAIACSFIYSLALQPARAVTIQNPIGSNPSFVTATTSSYLHSKAGIQIDGPMTALSPLTGQSNLLIESNGVQPPISIQNSGGSEIAGFNGDGGLFVPYLYLTSEGKQFSYDPTMEWGSYIATLNATQTLIRSEFVARQSITITRLVGTAATAAAGCTTSPAVELEVNGTDTAAIAFANGSATEDSGALSDNVAKGDDVAIYDFGNGAGCSTSPAGVNVTVEYVMQ